MGSLNLNKKMIIMMIVIKGLVAENGCCNGARDVAPGGLLSSGFNVVFIDSMCKPPHPSPFCAFVWRHRSIMKDGIANNSTASISHARKAVEQLKMEACMDRIKVSKAAADLMAYCDAHIREDPLIVPVPASENPFREKKFFCTIL
uniref:Guanine nucleotide-binding protein subunit gamma n=1 Tax=Scophthalmus maximus TaxID=52904 RepID=A0A8D3D0J5_SCOMX